MKKIRLIALAFASLLAACATTHTTTTERPPETRPEPQQPETPPATDFALQTASFSELPGWTQADLAPALLAFKRTCEGRRLRDPAAALPMEQVARARLLYFQRGSRPWPHCGKHLN